MKKLLLISFLFIAAVVPGRVYGQWSLSDNFINFDLDTLPPYVNYADVIYIYTVHYHHNIWQVGAPHKTVFNAPYSYPNAIITDTLNPYPPNDTSVFTFTFPDIAVVYPYTPIAANFSFFYQLNIDTGATVLIEFSKDSGRTWINLQDTTPPTLSYVLPLLKTPWWHEFYLTFLWGLVGDTLSLKFTLISGNDTSGKDGWMIDNLWLDYYTEGIPTIQNNTHLTLYPNPATTQLTISAPNAINDITITNLLGQRVMTSPDLSKGAEVISIDVSGLPAGLYFVKVNGSEVRKFLKE